MEHFISSNHRSCWARVWMPCTRMDVMSLSAHHVHDTTTHIPSLPPSCPWRSIRPTQTYGHNIWTLAHVVPGTHRIYNIETCKWQTDSKGAERILPLQLSPAQQQCIPSRVHSQHASSCSCTSLPMLQAPADSLDCVAAYNSYTHILRIHINCMTVIYNWHRIL